MTMPNSLRRETAPRPMTGKEGAEKSAEPDTAARLSELIRLEDERFSTIDPAQILQRRTCPSGE
jgi:hypothetical protein